MFDRVIIVALPGRKREILSVLLAYLIQSAEVNCYDSRDFLQESFYQSKTALIIVEEKIVSAEIRRKIDGLKKVFDFARTVLLLSHTPADDVLSLIEPDAIFYEHDPPGKITQMFQNLNSAQP